jgi:uncharacterized membrane protein YfcA
MTLGLPLTDLIFCGIILFGAALVRGYSGFGFTAVLMAGMTFFLPVAQIVPLSVALEVLASVGQWRGVFRDVNWRRLGILMIFGLIGTPIGVYFLSRLPDLYLRTAVLVLILLSSTALLRWPARPFEISVRNCSLAGFVAGVVNGATAMSGLVLALFFTMTGERAAVIRATMIAYLFATDIWTAGLLAGSGFYDEVALGRIIAALPLLGLGIWIGSVQFHASTQAKFRQNILYLLVVLSAVGLLSMLF